MFTPITDPQDPRIAPYRDIRERDLAGRGGIFIAEGAVVVRILLTRSRHAPQSVLIAEGREEALMPELQAWSGRIPVYRATRPVLDRIAGFPMHRGILAAGIMTETAAPGSFLSELPGNARIVALQGIANHDNMGGIFRNAAAFGASAVLIDAECCPPLYRKAIRVSAGAALMVPTFRFETTPAMIAAMEGAGFSLLALSPRGREDIRKLRPQGRTALLLGTEGAGLPDDILDRCRTVRIAMEGAFDSLNVAVTSGIALHRMFPGNEG